jgi:hypothetical protein
MANTACANSWLMTDASCVARPLTARLCAGSVDIPETDKLTGLAFAYCLSQPVSALSIGR